jgi:hypothetical protein
VVVVPMAATDLPPETRAAVSWKKAGVFSTKERKDMLPTTRTCVLACHGKQYYSPKVGVPETHVLRPKRRIQVQVEFRRHPEMR